MNGSAVDGEGGASNPARKTRASSGITDFDEFIAKAEAKAPTYRLVSIDLVSIDAVGVAVAFLARTRRADYRRDVLHRRGYRVID
jgi:enoyl-[acyl-carrier-protein] reductase (NADH)